METVKDEIIKDENGIDTTVMRNDQGQVIARIHGEMNIDLIARFLIKNSKTPKQ